MIEFVCILCPVLGTMVSFAFRSPLVQALTWSSSVYLDNAKAMNKLLLKELDE